VFLENTPGALCAMTKVLEDNDIDMRAFSWRGQRLRNRADHSGRRVYKTPRPRDPGYVNNVTKVLAGGPRCDRRALRGACHHQ
jgi:hypothetical protein